MFNRIKRYIGNKGYARKLKIHIKPYCWIYGRIPEKPAIQELMDFVITGANERRDITGFIGKTLILNNQECGFYS